MPARHAIQLEHLGHGLFITGDTDPAHARLAFVHRSADPPSTSIPFVKSWQDDDSAGTYCFVARLPKDKAAFSERIRKEYGPGSGKATSRWLLWFDDPDDPDARFQAALHVGAQGATQTTASFRFGNASVLFPRKAKIAVAEDRFEVTGPLVLHPDLDPPDDGGDASQVIAALEVGVAAERQGTLAFDVDLNQVGLDALDIGLRYFWKASDSRDPYRSVRFPLIEPDEGVTVPLTGHLDPFEPATGGPSFYRFRSGDGSKDTPLATYLRTASGRRIELIPVCESGDSLRLARLVFAPNPALKSKTSGTPLYLTPDGDFELSVAGGNSVEAAGARLLTGMAGAEYVSFRPRQSNVRGDLLSFFSDHPALARAPGVGTASTHEADPLSDQLTTSWVGLRAHPESAPASSSNQYFAQPDDAPLFAPAQGIGGAADGFLGFFEFPAAILPEPSSEKCFPMVPHAGVSGQEEVADRARRLESGVLSPARKNRISGMAASPRSVKGTDEQRIDSTTPQGLVAGVEGSHWADLLLASGDDVLLHVKDVSDAFQSALQSSKLFLVVSEEGALGAFSKDISIGGWPFKIDLGASVDGDEGSEIGNVLIFKFYDESMERLVRDLGVWSDADGFNAEPTQLQSWLLNYFAEARKKAASGPDDPEHHLYSHFVQEVLDNPDWNGIIALNVKIPLDSLPEEMQGLMGGIDTSRFKAHHLGIELNQVSADASGIDKSSLFALIDYQGAPKALALLDDPSSSYDFKVKTLQVLFVNSEIKDFRSRILLTLNQLFDEKASLEGGDGAGDGGKPNTIELQGSYERHQTGNVDAQGEPEYETAYSFTYEGKKLFKLDSPIIESVEIDKVRFSTLSATAQQGNGENKRIGSEFSFWGSLTFGEVGDLDFFSFDDLGFAELKLGMVFDIVDGKAGKPSYYFDPGNIRFDVSFSRTRQDSLLGNFPLRLKAFTYASRGFSVEKRGYTSVPDLIPGVGAGTDSPHFGLAFDLDLGSMGALTSAVKGFAIEVLAAWAPQSAGGGVDFGVKLPESGGGKKEIGIEGVLTLKADNFGFRKIPPDAESPPYVYAFFLKKSVLTVFSTRLPPGDGEFDLLLFVPRTGQGSVDVSSLGWFVAYSDPGEARGEKEEEGSPVFLKYLCLGQHVRIPETDVESMRTVEDALTTLSEKIVPNAQGDEQIEQLKSVYDPDGGWLIGIDVTLYEAVRLGIVFAEPKLYGLLVGLYEPEALRNFQFQVLYKKVSDDIGVYQIVVQLPDTIRQLEFGAVSVTMPVVGVDIYTNGDFRLDFGFPQGKDFSSSFALQAFPFVGFGGFYFARLSGATSSTVPDLDPDKGRFDPVLELGFGLSLGVGKTIEKGIMRAGLTVTFEGILEGTAAYFVSHGQSSLPAASQAGALTSVASTLDKPPDFYLVRGQFALVGTLYGTVDFGIVKATLSVTIWAGVSITFEAYQDLLLEIAAGVTVRLTVIVGGIKVFGHKIEIKVSFSFETTIRYQWTLADDRKPPYEWALRGGAVQRLPRAEPAAGAIAWKPTRVFPQKQPITLYLAPHLSTAMEQEGDAASQRAQLVVTLAIECATGDDQPAEPAPFDLLLEGLLIWAVRLSTDSKEIDAGVLSELSRRLAVPVTLARTAEGPLTYYADDGVGAGSLQEFLAQNFDITIAGFPEADSGVGRAEPATGAPTLTATVFPIIPDLSLTYSGASDPVRFWEQGGRFDDAYQDALAVYLAQLIANFEPKRDNGQGPAIGATSGSSVATLLLEDYFALLIKAAVDHAERYLDGIESEPVTIDALVQGMREAGAFTQIAGMAARFLQHGLRLPPAFPVKETAPAYRMDGQQVAVILPESADWTAALSLRQGVSWIKLDSADPPTLTIAQGDEQARQRIRDLETAKVSIADVTVEPLPALLRTVASYAFENHIEWSQKQTGETWTIWPFPTSLLRELDSEGGDDLALTLHKGRVGTGPRNEPDPDPELPHSWALSLDFSLARIPQSTGGAGGDSQGFLADTYQVGGTNEAARDRLERLLDGMAGGKAPAIESCNLLFRRADNSSGLVSPAIDPAKILLLKTNLSTQTAPPQVRAGAKTTAESAEVFSASLADPADFLRLLWEVSIVNAPGYYLLYRDADGGGVPEGAFDESTGRAEVSLVVTFASQAVACAAPALRGTSGASVEGERVAWFCDALVVRRDIAAQGLRAGPRGDAKAVLYAQAPEVPAWRPAFEPGCVGFRLARPNGAKRQAQASDVQAHVDNLFNLLAYWVPEGDDFMASPKGLPLGPIETGADAGNGAEPDHWTYEHVVPVYRYAKTGRHVDEVAGEETIGRREMNHFRPIGRAAPLDFQFLDIFGNEMVADQPIPTFEGTVGYFDPLIPMDRWPSLAFDWYCERDQKKLPWLVVELAFDPSGYGGSDSARGDAEEEARLRRIRTDLERYDQIAEQLLGPGVSLAALSSLAPGHDLSNRARLIELQHFVNKIRRALSRLSSGTTANGGDAGPSGPITQRLVFGIDDAQRADQERNIFEVSLDLQITREPDLLDAQAAKVYPAAGAALTRVPPRASRQKSEGQMALDGFATGFERVFADLKLASGLGEGGPQSLFAVRIGSGADRQGGIRYRIDPLGKGAYFYAPAPLSNALVSREILSFGDADAPARVSGVDLDVWAREFLGAVDRFLAADRAVQARQNAAAAYERIVAAKKVLADAIAGGVTHVVEPDPPEAAVAEARRAFRQRLLVDLSSAYEIDTVVQYEAATRNSQPEATPANLYGKVVSSNGTGIGADDETQAGNTLSSAKLALPDGESLLTFLFSTSTPSDQSHVPLDLVYQVTHVEHEISHQAGPTDRYRASSWLSFVQAFDPIDLGTADIPVALREYPRPPSLLRQSALPTSTARCPEPPDGDADSPLRVAKLWNYGVTYQQGAVAQDTMFSNIKFNVSDDHEKAVRGADREADLVDWLARFRRRYADLEPELPSKAAVESFAELVEGVASVWAPWIQSHRTTGRARLLAGAVPKEYEYQHRIEEIEHRSSDGGTEVEVRISAEGDTPADFPHLAIDVNGQRRCIAPEEQASGSAVYTFERGEASELRERTIIFDRLDVLDTENAWGGVQLVRNLVLLPGDDAPSTNPLFVYQTPLVRFVNKQTPLLDVRDAIDLGASVDTPSDQTLQGYLSSFFSTLFGSADRAVPGALGDSAQRRIQLTIRYGYDLRGSPGQAAGGPDDPGRPIVYLPLLHRPPFGFDLAGDGTADAESSFVSGLAASLVAWLDEEGPDRAGGFFLFDLAVFAALSDAQLPILHLRRVWLGLDRLKGLPPAP